MSDQNTNTPWQDMVAPTVRKLTVGATFADTVVYNKVGAKALSDMIQTMAKTLDETRETVEWAKTIIERKEAEDAYLRNVNQVLEDLDIDGSRRHAAQKFIRALFRARKKELKK